MVLRARHLAQAELFCFVTAVIVSCSLQSACISMQLPLACRNFAQSIGHVPARW